MTEATTLPALKERTNALTETRPGFSNQASFELMQRGAKLLSNSTLVPVAYRAVIEKTDRYGKVTDRQENPAAMSNCVVALNMANRVGADPLMVMQNLYIVEGRPSWSSQYIIAAINSCGRYSPLRFDISDPEPEREVEYKTTKWSNGERHEVVQKIKVKNRTCVAWAIEKETGQRLESPPVSLEMAIAEGWLTKNGSKWQTMPDVMLRYRAASFFGRLYAPELLMGLQSAEELHDTIEMVRAPDGNYEAAETVKERVDSATEATVVETPASEEQQAAVREASVVEPVEMPHDPAADKYPDMVAEIRRITKMPELIRFMNNLPAKMKKELHEELEQAQAMIRQTQAQAQEEAETGGDQQALVE